ncbi:hypothetical protein SAMN05518672_103539 [Chitinophaga sp. CF118]|uniref:hypothetical protein n=1 Tax=Chitinophaga sp. CF118 TaxID=1884367 RepID=UPI0008EBFA2B|nr:hypothetical protein [Chitinophaga sp. CF118]SFD85654.1 hypothetical protein SAMN05518672_103539 [Chitinophaga sp. CF118]
MKIVCWSLLLGTLITTIAHAQYADDNVTIRDNRKAKDPFKVSKKVKKIDSSSVYESRTIPLKGFDLSAKVPTGLDISDIQVINAVSDSSLLGYVQSSIFNICEEAIPDKPYTLYLQSYVDRSYRPIYKKDAIPLVWVIQELRIGERTFGMSEKGYLHLKAMAFVGNGNGTFKRLTQLDTILVRGGMDVTHKHDENIRDGLHILLERSLAKDVLLQKIDSSVYTMSAIREEALKRYQKPALQSQEHIEGIYLTFEEFINDQPSVKNVTYSLEHNTVRFFYTDSSGKKSFIDKFWGVRKNGLLLKQYYDLLIPIEQKQNSIVLTNYLPLARSKNNATLLAILGGGLGGAIVGAAMGGQTAVGTLPIVENIPYIKKKAPIATGVDIETGEFTL